MRRLWELVSAYYHYDPAASSRWEILFLYPGVHAILIHRAAHRLWRWQCRFLARGLGEFARRFTGIEIHPGARLGHPVIIDHGMGVVIGETAVIGDHVIIYQGVTLGGTSLDRGTKRHPTIEDHVVIGSGAKVLGNIEIGSHVRVGANSVVVKSVPAHSSVVGIPGRIVGEEKKTEITLDHGALPDPIERRLAELEGALRELQNRP